MKFNQYLISLLKMLASICFVALVIVVFIQFFYRSFMPQSPGWTEEISRFLFIFSVVFAAPVALYNNEYIEVDILFNKFAPSIQWIIRVITYIALIIFFIIIGYRGIDYIKVAMYQTAPASGIKMSIPYSSISILMFLMAYFCTIKLFNLLTNKNNIGR